MTDTQGNALAMPDNIRLFLLSNLQHYSLANAKPEMVKVCAYPTNPLNAGPPVRALLVALDDLDQQGCSLLPARLSQPQRDGTLVPPSADDVGFSCASPGFAYTSRMARPTLIKSRTRCRPPRARPIRCSPKTDADGRDIAGLHLPTLDAPVGTHTGWNLRKAGFGEGELCDNNGSMIPFAATREERQKTDDPRLSLAERYPNNGDRAAAISEGRATTAK